MTNIKNNLLTLMLAAAVLCGCAGNDDVDGDVDAPDMEYKLPQGGNDAADATILQWHDAYGTFFLYDFTDKDFTWTMVDNASLGDDVYQYEKIDPADVPALLSLLKDTWLDLYTADFLKRYLPRHVFMVKSLQLGVQDSWWSDDYTWHDIAARSLDNQMAVGSMGKNTGDFTSAEKQAYKGYLNAVFLSYLFESGYIAVPESFYSVSDYTQDLWWESTEKARNAGFVYDPKAGSEWATEDYSLSKQSDLNAYIASLTYCTDAEWADDMAAYPLIKKKHDILVNALSSAGIDISEIGNKTY